MSMNMGLPFISGVGSISSRWMSDVQVETSFVVVSPLDLRLRTNSGCGCLLLIQCIFVFEFVAQILTPVFTGNFCVVLACIWLGFTEQADTSLLIK
jgi:hypothetical protein